MDDLHLSDFREDFDIACSAVMGISFNAYMKKFIFSGQGFGCANFKAGVSYISHFRNFIALTGNSALLRNMTILNLITPFILFQENLDKTFKNFIGNFIVANKVKLQGGNKRVIIYTSSKLLVLITFP